ncbi:MAG TPA: hypothetical protein VEL28_04055 [Candidatus Binatia bacterium]|nr:hypothetical protein [Candidatus Binatia bacterium]
MFMLGFLGGLAAAAAFVLYGNVDRLIELAEKARHIANKWNGVRY